MKEVFDAKEYRKKLAKRLVEIRDLNRDIARNSLAKAKKGGVYEATRIAKMNRGGIHKDYGEITYESINKGAVVDLFTEQGSCCSFIPFPEQLRRAEEARTVDDSTITDLSKKVVGFYSGHFDALFGLSKDFRNPGESPHFPFQGYESKSMTNTDFSELEGDFTTLVERYRERLEKKGVLKPGYSIDSALSSSPEELALLVNAVVIEHMRYDTNIQNSFEVSEMSDGVSVDRILKGGGGVCRHFSHVASVLFEHFKRKQISNGKNGFAQSFLLNITDAHMNHAYGVYVRVLPNADLLISVLDPTHANTFYSFEGKDIDIATILDRTTSRSEYLASSSLVGRILPENILTIPTSQEKVKIEVHNETIKSFLNLYRYIAPLSPKNFDSVAKFNDFVSTVLITPTGWSSAKKHRLILEGAMLVLCSYSTQDLSERARGEIQVVVDRLIRENKDHPSSESSSFSPFEESVFEDWMRCKEGKSLINTEILDPTRLVDNEINTRTFLFIAESLSSGIRKFAEKLSKKLEDGFDSNTLGYIGASLEMLRSGVERFRSLLDWGLSNRGGKGIMKPLKVLDDSGQFAFLSDFVKEEISSSSTQHFYSALMGLPTVRVHSYERGREVVLCDEVVLLFKECVEIFNDIVSRFDKKLKNFRSIDRFLDTTSSFFYRDKKIGLEQLIVFCNNLRDPKVKDILSSFEGIISQMDMGVIFGGVEESFEDITTRFLGVLDTINIYFKGDKKKISTYEIWSFLRQFIIPGEIGYFQRDNEVTNHLFLDDYRKKQGINISNIIVARFGGKKEYYRRFLEDCARLFIMKTEIENLISSTENPEVCAAFSKFLKK